MATNAKSQNQWYKLKLIVSVILFLITFFIVSKEWTTTNSDVFLIY
jgi:hypothetical protein